MTAKDLCQIMQDRLKDAKYDREDALGRLKVANEEIELLEKFFRGAINGAAPPPVVKPVPIHQDLPSIDSALLPFPPAAKPNSRTGKPHPQRQHRKPTTHPQRVKALKDILENHDGPMMKSKLIGLGTDRLGGMYQTWSNSLLHARSIFFRRSDALWELAEKASV